MACCCVNKLCNDNNRCAVGLNSDHGNCDDNNCMRRSHFLRLVQDKIRSDTDSHLTFLLCLASLFSVLAGW